MSAAADIDFFLKAEEMGYRWAAGEEPRTRDVGVCFDTNTQGRAARWEHYKRNVGVCECIAELLMSHLDLWFHSARLK